MDQVNVKAHSGTSRVDDCRRISESSLMHAFKLIHSHYLITMYDILQAYIGLFSADEHDRIHKVPAIQDCRAIMSCPLEL